MLLKQSSKRRNEEYNTAANFKGYNEYEVAAIVEDDKQVDVANKFHNTFENANMDAVQATAARIIKERESRQTQ